MALIRLIKFEVKDYATISNPNYTFYKLIIKQEKAKKMKRNFIKNTISLIKPAEEQTKKAP